MKTIIMKLKQNYFLFDKDSSWKYMIIITLYQLFIIYYESSVLDHWHHKKKNILIETRKDAENILNLTWSKYLSDYFETVILNEVHLIQNLFIWSSVIIKWLNSDFHVCMFIILLFNVLENFRDFLLLLFNNNELWISVLLKKLDVNTIVNLFEL